MAERRSRTHQLQSARLRLYVVVVAAAAIAAVEVKRLHGQDSTQDEITTLKAIHKLGSDSVPFLYEQSKAPVLPEETIRFIGRQANNKTISDAIRLMQRLPRLKYLQWCQVGADDSGVAGLDQLIQLECVDIYDAHFGDETCRQLSKLKRLKNLSLVCADVTSQGVEHLGSLSDLEFLSLSTCKRIKPGCFRKIARLQHLIYLNVSGLDIGDEDLASFAKHPALMTIEAGGTKLTAKCLETIMSLPCLKTAGLPRDILTDDLIEEVHRRKPELFLVGIDGTFDCQIEIAPITAPSD